MGGGIYLLKILLVVHYKQQEAREPNELAPSNCFQLFSNTEAEILREE